MVYLNMKSEDVIQAKFNELVQQRDSCEVGSAARRILNERLLTLAWVLDHHLARELLLSEKQKAILECVS